MRNPDPLPPQEPGQPATAVIDILQFDERTGTVRLVLVERKPWDLSSDQPFLLQEKLNAYVSFILDGEMLDHYPQFANRPVAISLECVTPPPEPLIPFLQLVRDQCELQGIEFTVDVRGSLCGCGKPIESCNTTPSTRR